MTPRTSAMPAATSLAQAFEDHLRAAGPLPVWWVARQRAAFAEFESLPYPRRKDERWRFSSVQNLAVEGFDHAAGADASAGLEARSGTIPDATARLVFGGDTLVHADPLPPELAARGVIFEPLATALERHGALLEEHFAAQSTRLGADKFAALHAAFVRAGVLLYVPAGVEIERPFSVHHWAVRANSAVYPHTLLITGANAKVSLADCFFSTADAQRHLAVSMSHVFAGDGSQVRYKVFQNWNEEALAFHLVSLTAAKDALVKNLSVNLGAAQFRSETQSVLDGPGSRVETYSLAVTEGTQEIDQRTLQIHNAPHASSDLLFKNALLDDSRTIFSGLIQVAQDAQRTDAYQSNRNLLLSPTAEANSLPGLEIGANDVRCTHGSTTGQIDTEEMFYMQARGITPHLARHLLVFGFFEEVLAKVEDEGIRESLRAMIQEKFTRHERR